MSKKNFCIGVLCEVGELKMGIYDVVSCSTELVCAQYFKKVVVEVTVFEFPYVLRLWLWIRKCMNPTKAFCLTNTLSFLAVKFYGLRKISMFQVL